MSEDVLEDLDEITLADLCRRCGMSADKISDYVSVGLIDPRGRQVSAWRFSEVAIIRLQKAERLQRDLGLNLAGAALALELYEEIETLRRRLAGLETSES